MTYPERFDLLRAVSRGEITSDDAVRLMGIPEQTELRLEAG